MTSPEAQYEEQTEAAVTGEFMLQVTTAVAAILSAWVAAKALGKGFGSIRSLARKLFGDLEPRMRQPLLEALAQAPGLAGSDPSTLPLDRDKALAMVARDIDQRATRRLESARRLARYAPMDTLEQIGAIAAAGRRAGTGAEADTRWAATRAVSLGAALEAREAGARLIWVPERNACLSCLAYAGLDVTPGELFPAGLSYGKAPASQEAVPYPPLHPNCRCRVEPWFGEQDIADALKREAQRSVARGFSSYASRRAKLDAANRLINRQTRLPKTVRRRAARDVSLGTFSGRHNVKQPALAPGRK